MASSSVANKVVLVSIDGWGISSNKLGNAIANAKTPVMDSFETKTVAKDDKRMHAQLDASGLAVGLPRGLMGNSEVGHLTMGAGRVQFQDLVRINLALENKDFFSENEIMRNTFERAKNGNKRIHFLGLVSDGGVHSHIEHLFQFLKGARAAGVPEAYVHFFADGRDTAPTSAVQYIEQLQTFLKSENYGSLATVVGRYYAMDRDQRWDRIKVAYEAVLGGVGEAVTDAGLIDAVKKRYENKENDEFLMPFIVNPQGVIQDDDTLVFIDFRSDRMREIVQCVGLKPAFETDIHRKNLGISIMTQYNAKWQFPIIFPAQSMDNVLAEWISKQGLSQFHIAETEKYAHVTFFFNGGREAAFANEERQMVPSPKVATYDLQPYMSAAQVGVGMADAIATGKYPFLMCNFAPPDMVGHTGVYDAAVTACEATDAAIGVILEACQKHGYVLVITADHGNAEEMLDENGKPKTSHTTNLVPLNICGPEMLPFEWERSVGGLADVAPTVLHLMGLSIPSDMTGKSMLKSTA